MSMGQGIDAKLSLSWVVVKRESVVSDPLEYYHYLHIRTLSFKKKNISHTKEWSRLIRENSRYFIMTKGSAYIYRAHRAYG